MTCPISPPDTYVSVVGTHMYVSAGHIRGALCGYLEKSLKGRPLVEMMEKRCGIFSLF